MKPSWINEVNLYLLAWCLYSTQGILFPDGNLFTQLLVIVLLLVSLYYMFIANTRYKLPIYFMGLNLLLGMFFVYGIYLMIGGYNPAEYPIAIPSFNYLKSILISLAPIYPFYVFSKERLINEKTLRIWFFILLGFTIANYYHNYQRQLYMAMLVGSKAQEFTNNIGYNFVALIPICVFFYKKPVFQYVALGICMVFLFMAMKRGAVIIGVLCLLWFMWTNLRDTSFKRKFGVVALSLSLCFVGYLFIEKQMRESLYFQKRVEITLEGNSSNRDKIYGRIADYFLDETTPLQFVLGSGANATLKVSGNYAHNDWLEIAVNQGLFGVVIYIMYWIFFGWVAFSKRYNSHVKCALQLLFIFCFLRTLFSMSYADMTLGATLVLGYCLAQERNDEQIIYSN